MKHNWEYKNLDEVCTIKSGYTPSSDDLASDGDFPYFKVAEMNLPGNEKYLIHSPSYLSGNIKTFPANSIVFPKNGAAVSTNKKRILQVASVVDLNTAVMMAHQNISVNYLYYILINIDFATLVKRGAVPTLNIPEFKKHSVPLPPMEVQQQIVAELDKINEIIEDCRELLRNLDALAQSLFYDYFGDPITNPKGWEMKKLSDECLDIVDGDHSAPPKSDNGIPFITISNIDKSRHKIDFTNSFFVPQDYYDGLKENRKARKGDVLYTVTGSYGVTVLITDEPKFCFQRHIGLIRPKTSLNSVYMAYWGRSSAIKSIADTAATGIAQKTISIKALRNFPLILPPLSLQEKFAERIEQIEEQKKTVEETIKRMQTLLDSRMDYWFN